MTTPTHPTLDDYDADGHTDETAYLTGYDAVDALEALRDAQGRGVA